MKPVHIKYGPDGPEFLEMSEHPGAIDGGAVGMIKTYASHTSFAKDEKYAKHVEGFNDFMEKNAGQIVSIALPEPPDPGKMHVDSGDCKGGPGLSYGR